MSTSDEEQQAKRLREQAEEIVHEKQHGLSNAAGGNLQSLVHELQVHQEELNLQNDELRRTQLELESSRDQYADLYHNAPLGYCTIDTRGLILEANQTLAVLLETSINQLLRHRLFDFIPAEDRDGFYLHIQHILENESNQIIDLQIQKQNGQKMLARLESAIDRIDHGRIRITISDNTERKQAQLAMEGYARDLERANITLKDFTFIASHDLREPLRKVKAFAEILTGQYAENLGPVGQDYLNRIVSAIVRMDAMLKGLLAYSQVASKGAPFIDVPLKIIVEEVISDLELHLSQTGGKVMIHDLPVIQADPLQMRILFQNLISNAIKYRRPDTPPVITLSHQDGPENDVKILVEDNGIGIDMKYAGYIFEPFSRLNGKANVDGSGMGLTICQKIMDRHNGTISVVSTPGQGCTFILTFPK